MNNHFLLLCVMGMPLKNFFMSNIQELSNQDSANSNFSQHDTKNNQSQKKDFLLTN